LTEVDAHHIRAAHRTKQSGITSHHITSHHITSGND
jgi:hypothetical protein